MDRSSKEPRLSDTAFLRRVLIVVAVGALVYTLWKLSEIILLIFGSVLVAIMLRALARPLIAYLRVEERAAVVLAGLIAGGLLVGGAVIFGQDIYLQLHGLSERVSAVAAGLGARLQVSSFAELLKGSPASSLGSIVANVFAWSTTLLNAVASLLLVVFGGVYLALNPRLYRAGLMKLVPAAAQPEIDATLVDAGEALRRWFGAQLIAMVLVGTVTGVGLWLIGMPSALALGLVMALAELVPIIGPIAAAIPVALVASGQDWQMVLWAVGVIVIVQQIESNLITPLIVGRTVSVAPAVALFAIVAMGVLFGPLGLLFGFPLALVIDVAVRRLYVADTLGARVDIMGKPAKKA
jgi:predicted PurR-regulated permease PerM